MKACTAILFIILLLSCRAVLAQSATGADEATVWKQLLQATNRPAPPAEWKKEKPTEEQLRKFYQLNIGTATAAAEKAKAFYTQFPDNTNAATAKALESKMSLRSEAFNRMLHRLDATVGKRLDIKFTSLDGREVDLSQMKGKVVLIDFWATWCDGCVAEIPHVKEVYNQFHTNGFEVIGISFDTDRKALENFIQKNGTPWPQYFDGQGWQNKYGVEYGFEQIPALWLIDKKGILRDNEAGKDLQRKVEKLLAE